MSEESVVPSQDGQQDQPPQQTIGMGIGPHPITGQILLFLNVKDKNGGEATVTVDANEALNLGARISAFGSFLFGQEQAAQIIARQQVQNVPHLGG